MPAVLVDRVSKRFRVAHPHRPQTLHEALTRGFGRLHAAEVFWALRDVSFEVRRATSLGLIGANGAGKSTLLRLIAKVSRPDAGRIEVSGRSSALLDLGAGFHPDLTGRENVHLAGVVLGLTRAEVRRRFDEVVDFAELHAFIDNPLRTYSTGMRMRLAFSVAALAEPDVFLLDEVLVVGDHAFQQKCIGRIESLRARGTTLLICTHDVELMRRLCQDAVWLDGGRVVKHGPADSVVDAYTRSAGAP